MVFDVVGIGNPVYDIIITPVIKTDGRVLSGCSTNACLALKKLGMQKVGLIGSIGKDYSKRFLLDMKHYGIETSLSATSVHTGGFRLVYDHKGDRTLEVLGVADKIVPGRIPEEFLDSRFFLIGPILGEVDVELIKFIRGSTSAKIFLDPQGLIRSIGSDGKITHVCNRDEFKSIVELVDFVKPNEVESETITGQKDPVLAVEWLRALGVKVPIVTLADRGSILLDSDRIYHIPAFHTDAIDPTGAGDTYAGSFIVEYDRTGSNLEAALFASAAASIMVEQVGPEFRMTEQEAMKRKNAIRGLLK